MRTKQFLVASFVVVFCSVLLSQGRAQPSNLGAVRVSSALHVDGLLNDEAWNNATPVDNFTQREPDEGKPATEKTEVRMVYDDRALYIGVSCFNRDPHEITAAALSRDFDFESEDNFEIVLDTYRDHRNAFLFIVNPNGARYDALLTDEGNIVNSDWNGVWDARTVKSSSGWFAEIEIPFSTLRFTGDSLQVWGVNFERNIRAKREQDLWQAFSRNSGLARVSQAGTLTGLRDIHRGRHLEIKPYALAGLEHGFSPYSDSRETQTKIGLDLKYPLTPTLTLDVTTHTDFAQVEADRAQINLTRYPLYFPEKREFFLEGAGIFSFTPQLFYSRRIGLTEDGREIPIIGGLRMQGKAGKYDIGVLDMQTEEKDETASTNFAVARVKREILQQSYFGVIATDKERSGYHNRALGADTDLRFANVIGNNNLEAGGSVSTTQTTGLKGKNLAYRAFVSYPNDLISQYISYRNVEPNYNPEVGFITHWGKQMSWYFDLQPRPHWSGIQKLLFKPVYMDYYWDVNNRPESAFWEFMPFGFMTDGGETFEFKLFRNYDRLAYDFEIFPGVTIPKGEYLFTRSEVQMETNTSRDVAGGVLFLMGDFYGGVQKQLYLTTIVKTSSHLWLTADYNHTEIDLPAGSFITRELGGEVRYAFSTLLNSSLFGQWNNETKEVNLNVRLNWIPRIGSDVYLVYNHLFNTNSRVRSKSATTIAKVAYRLVW